jgi:hypothetical protein
MPAQVGSAVIQGVEAYPVGVDVNARRGDTLLVIIVSIPPSLARFLFANFQ